MPLTSDQCHDLLEIIEARSIKGSVIFCTQFEPDGWIDRMGTGEEATVAEAILDRIRPNSPNSYEILIKGNVSMRERHELKASKGWLIMDDHPVYYDLPDEVNCADSCEAIIALCELVDKLVADIEFLELECISTRYLLSQHMDEEHGELLRIDILSHLPPRYSGNPAYELYKDILYSGGDPMEFRERLVKVCKACKGD